ncbi:MAG: hypothetical protein KI790_17925, partial [Cyclobacteriaceae bacterium]|nr:hypothetical protein [Cyclobacteriaceae bacterium HetDA_MAG_MS6]
QGTFHQYPYALREEHPTESIGTSHDLALNELYAYARIDVLEKSKLGLGLRKNLTESTSGNYLSYQMNFSWSLTKQLTAIMGAGKYHMSLFNRNLNTKEFVSRYQASLDLKHDLPRFDHQLSLFYKDGSSTVIGENQILGLEYFVQYHIAGKLKGQTSVSSLRVSGSKDLELYDLDYFIKGNFSYELPASVTLAINYSWRQGSEYLQIRETRFDDDLQVHEPFFEENARNRFRDYRIISLHISKLHAVNEKLSIEYFGSVSNVADIKNERSWLYSHDYTTRTQEYFQRRLFYMGFNINFL